MTPHDTEISQKLLALLLTRQPENLELAQQLAASVGFDLADFLDLPLWQSFGYPICDMYGDEDRARLDMRPNQRVPRRLEHLRALHAQCPRQFFRVWQLEIPADAFARAADLRRLYLNWLPCAPFAPKLFAPLVNLEILSIKNCGQPIFSELLEGLGSLRQLIIRNAAVNLDEKALPALSKLRVLVLNYCILGPQTLDIIARLSNLRVLSLRGSLNAPLALDYFAKMQALHNLDLSHNPRLYATLDARIFGRLPKLAALHLDGLGHQKMTVIGNLGDAFPKLKHLGLAFQQLDLSQSPAALNNLPEWQALRLSFNPILSPDQPAALVNNYELRRIELRDHSERVKIHEPEFFRGLRWLAYINIYPKYGLELAPAVFSLLPTPVTLVIDMRKSAPSELHLASRALDAANVHTIHFLNAQMPAILDLDWFALAPKLRNLHISLNNSGVPIFSTRPFPSLLQLNLTIPCVTPADTLKLGFLRQMPALKDLTLYTIGDLRPEDIDLLRPMPLRRLSVRSAGRFQIDLLADLEHLEELTITAAPRHEFIIGPDSRPMPRLKSINIFFIHNIARKEILALLERFCPNARTYVH